MFKKLFKTSPTTPTSVNVPKEVKISSPFGMRVTGIGYDIENKYNKTKDDMISELGLYEYEYGEPMHTPYNDYNLAVLEMETGQQLLDERYYNSQAKNHFKNGIDILLTHTDTEDFDDLIMVNDYIGFLYEKMAEAANRENDKQSVMELLNNAKTYYEKIIEIYEREKESIYEDKIAKINKKIKTSYPNKELMIFNSNERLEQIKKEYEDSIDAVKNKLENVNKLVDEYSAANKQGGKKRKTRHNRRTTKKKAAKSTKSRKARK